ncbi:MAG: hypothetical protein GY716_16415 [bacterium]|nr:hypothetical protein [bacterium]
MRPIRLAFLLLLLGCCGVAGVLAHPRTEPAESADGVSPLLVGTTVPSQTVRDAEGNELDLRKAVGGKPTVLIFYRGGW